MLDMVFSLKLEFIIGLGFHISWEVSKIDNQQCSGVDEVFAVEFIVQGTFKIQHRVVSRIHVAVGSCFDQ